MNTAPRITVTARAFKASSRFAASSPWCAQVMVKPDPTRMAVFTRGTANGSIGSIPTGGHVQPISGAGLRALWKKAQKNPKKNIASDNKNRSIPIRRPRAT